MEAMIFAAGLGTRLRDVIKDKPKALVEIGDTTLLDFNINKLISFGVNHIVVNVHHFAQKVIRHIEQKNYDAQILISDESSLLLDTGGGLRNARHLFSNEQDILLHNVDIVSDVDFSLLRQAHLDNSEAIATLAISKRSTSRQILFDEKLQLSGWQNNVTKEEIITNNHPPLTAFGFSGIAVVSPSIFDLLDQNGVFSIMPQYLKISNSHPIKGFVHNAERWLDVGKPESLSLAAQLCSLLSY